jgi:hypothetical protein
LPSDEPEFDELELDEESEPPDEDEDDAPEEDESEDDDEPVDSLLLAELPDVLLALSRLSLR